MLAVQGGHFFICDSFFSEGLFKQNQFAFWLFKLKSNKQRRVKQNLNEDGKRTLHCSLNFI